MAQFDVLDINGIKVDTVELSDAVFGIEPNKVVMHESVVNYLANQRQGTHSTKTRSEVRGGGRKPWKQKGTGRARQGSIRSPQWVHGGIALGPKPRDYSYKINKKSRRLAIVSALSEKAKNNTLVIVDNYDAKEFKTKHFIEMFKNLNIDNKTLLVQAVADKKVLKSSANMSAVKTTLATTMNAYDIINARTLLIDLDSAKKLEEVFK